MIGLVVAFAAGAPLTEADVLAALDARVPAIAAAIARQDLAEAKRLDARGGTDPRWSAALLREESYYPSTRADLDLAVDTALGATLGVGYRAGLGEFATWDGKARTLDRGEVRADLALPLRDLGLPEVRADIAIADLGAAAARADADDVVRSARLAASRAYWKWVEAGRVLAAEEALLERAIRRDAGLSTEVDAGSRPEIDVLDNARVVAKRRARVAKAEADLTRAAESLGLWLREEDGTPRPPAREELPPPAVPAPGVEEGVDAGLARALARRPELRGLEADLEAADVAVRRARRELLPDLVVAGSVSQDLGDGLPEKAPLEVRVGGGIAGTLRWREGRAAVAAAEARRAMRVAERRRVADAIAAEVRSAHAAWVAAARTWEATAEAAAVAETLLERERRRMTLGGSDVFRLILREEALLDASLEMAEAEAAYFTARAAWRAATMYSE